MSSLPATSKCRNAGMKDVIQTFDPIRHHGANLPRFRELRQSLPLEQVSNDLFLAHEEPDLCQVDSTAVEPSVVVCSHFVDYLSDCYDDGVRRFRHVVVRVHDYLPTTC